MKVFRYYLIALAYIPLSFVYAQEKVMDVITHFSQSSPVQWRVAIPNSTPVTFTWYERYSSFSKEGFRTFVAYYNHRFAGSISINDHILSGEIWHEGKTYTIHSDNGTLHISAEKETSHCGACTDNSCKNITSTTSLPASLARNTSVSELKKEEKNILYNTNVLRIFRLALLIDYSYYHSLFNDDINQTQAFMARIEAGLNEVFGRELGCQFELVNDPRLIRNSKEKELYKNQKAYDVVSKATNDFNTIIGEEAYDAGVILSAFIDNRGYAYTGQIAGSKKGNCVANNQFYIILHELGHLFGSAHTFTVGGDSGTTFTEPDLGNSIMSYIGDPFGTYFSLPSIHFIRKLTEQNASYYKDRERSQLVGLPQRNVPYGILTDNRAPIIQRDKLKNSYTLPPNTYFQFNIEATDPDGDPLLYMAHQADINQQGKARFPSYRPTTNPHMEFYRPYRKDKNTNEWEEIPHKFTNETETGDFTFWLGVSDGAVGAYKNGKPHAILYDVYETKVNITSGTPFRITNVTGKSSARKYKQGEEITLLWNVDTNIFGKESKVRILFSDDYGKTYKYVLADGIPNSGKAKVIFPVQAKGWNGGTRYIEGIFKIEVIDHIAYAISTDKPYLLDMQGSDIIFNNLPEPTITVKKNAVPQVPDVTANSPQCSTNKTAKVTFKEEDHITYLLRQWIATDDCNHSAIAQQFIYYEKEASNQPFSFIESSLPKNITISCTKHLPKPIEVQTQGGCGKISVITKDNISNNICANQYSIERIYTASDGCSSIIHKQIIKVEDKEKPVFLGKLPEDITINEGEAIPEGAILSATDNCSTLGKVSPTKTQQKNTIIYQWTATDECGNKAIHTQTITIIPKKEPFSFIESSLPKNITISCSKHLPKPIEVQTQGGCGKVSVITKDNISNNICANQYSIERIYTASDGCSSIIHKQIIKVEDKEKPVFLGILPEDITINEGEAIPEGTILSATDNCSTLGKVSPTETQQKNSIIYQWTATDECGNKATHTQTITIIPKKEEQGTTKLTEPIIYNGISTETSSGNYFKIEAQGVISPLQVQIFNQLGLLVYYSEHYQENGDIFQGRSNVQGVLSRGKLLEAGTYFYILQYQNAEGQQVRKGFLFIK
ncbi:MAG: M12 family metallo-peptidase [Capnocytophaga sp.]|nr:M12 family metallo-peptidase [Capnocytophaga sp.]